MKTFGIGLYTLCSEIIPVNDDKGDDTDNYDEGFNSTPLLSRQIQQKEETDGERMTD